MITTDPVSQAGSFQHAQESTVRTGNSKCNPTLRSVQRAAIPGPPRRSHQGNSPVQPHKETSANRDSLLPPARGRDSSGNRREKKAVVHRTGIRGGQGWFLRPLAR